MTQLWFPGLKFNGLRINRGQLLDVSLLGVGIAIPPWDMQILPAITFWEPFLIIDTDWWGKVIGDAVAVIPKAVWDYLTGTIQAQIDAYYKEHPERKQK